MTQRIFDIENEKDMVDLWDILPDDANEIEKYGGGMFIYYKNEDCARNFVGVFSINWHDKTEIFRPIKEATENDIGKLCYFWEGKDFAIGILKGIGDDSSLDIYCMEDSKSGVWFAHCRRLTKQEIEEIC